MTLGIDNHAGWDQMGSSGAVFPLRFTPFEYFFWRDARPHYEAIIPVELEARGHFDHASFERAYLWTHQRHPLLPAQITVDAKGWPFWIPGTPAPVRYGDNPLQDDR